jgi:hypothetical protein
MGSGYHNETSARKGGDDFNQNRRKNRVFTPVSIKMIQEAPVNQEDVCEIDGEGVQEVS